MLSNKSILEVENIVTRFRTQEGLVHAVNGISFELKKGELLGVVGESGAGKSVTMMSLLKLLPIPPAEIVSGKATFEGHDLSISFAKIDRSSALSIASYFAEVQQLTSNIHLSSNLSVNSSHIVSLSTETLSVNNINTNHFN